MQLFPALFEEAVRLYPHRDAINEHGSARSYTDLHARVTDFQKELVRRDVQVGDRVAIEGIVSEKLVAAVAGCLCANVVFLILDPTLPQLRRDDMLKAANPNWVIRLHGDGYEFSSFAELDSRASESGNPLDEDKPAYIFFTSGTTGIPKGVLGRSGGLAQFLLWERNTFNVGPEDRISLLTGLSFDVVLRDMLLPLISGATLHLPPADMPRDGRSVFDWLTRSGITLMHAVPSLARAWLQAIGNDFRNFSLRHCLFAGEPLNAALIGKWREHFQNAAIVNLYGPTETTLAKFFYRIPTSPSAGVQPVGHALPFTEAMILSSEYVPMPLGQSGEIVIRTRYPSLGYINAAEEQSARFILLPEGPAYRTGDIGFVDQHGLLHVTGRTDHQIKINGVRTEPAGITALIEAHPLIRQAAVIAYKKDDGEYALVAYYVRDDESAGDLAVVLRPYLMARLHSAMIPSLWIELPVLPLTANGKLDRKALPAPTFDSDMEIISPRDDMEKLVLDVWRSVLGKQSIGVTHDFFACGGSSLNAAEICGGLQRRLNRVVEPNAFLDYSTPAKLAEYLRNTPAKAVAGLSLASEKPLYPLSPQQRRYHAIFVSQDNNGSWSNMLAEIPLAGKVMRDIVAEALRMISERHDSLRLRFIEKNGRILQEFGPVRPISVNEVDLSHLDSSTQPIAFRELRIREGERVFEVDRWPLFSATLIHLSEDEKKVLWNIHHYGSDGRSQGILADELTEIVRALLNNRAPQLPILPVRYRDYSEWQLRLLQSPDMQAHRAYWASVYNFPYDQLHINEHGKRASGSRAALLRFPMPDDVLEQAKQMAKQQRTTLFIVLISAYFHLCHRLFGKNDLVIATPVNGRDHPDVARLIGNFISVVTIRNRLTPEMNFSKLIAGLRRQVPKAAEHQLFQFDELLAALGAQLEPDRYPLTTLGINFIPNPTKSMDTRERFAHDLGFGLRYDLLLMLKEFNDGLVVEFQYRSSVFTGEEITAVATHYVAGLVEVMQVADALIGLETIAGMEGVTSRAIERKTQLTIKPVAQDDKRFIRHLQEVQ